MIEITHQQARRMLREELDSQTGERLTGEQWSLLRAHLEGCDECRAYAAHLAGQERDLRRVLASRWSALRDPQPGLPGAVTAQRQRRLENLRRGAHWLVAVLGLLLLVGIASYRRWAIPPASAEPTATPSAAAPTVTPTFALDDFDAALVYEAPEEGAPGSASEIYLLTPRPDGPPVIENLTQHPAQDIEPVWSPDGEWLAFLSDRDAEGGAQGKFEIYVMHIAGSRLTRLTDEPEVRWGGPLSWSADGRWIALTGQSEASGLNAVYLVPVNPGEGEVRRLSFTRDAPGPLRFSPVAPLLAYQTAPGDGGLTVYDLEAGWFLQPTWEDDQDQRLRVAAFDWSPNEPRLVYLTGDLYEQQANPPAPRVKVTGRLAPGAFDSANNQTVYRASEAGAQRGLSWLPDFGERRMVFSQDEDGDGCWTVRVFPGRPHVDLPGLCVESDPDRWSWTPDGGWLVLAGRRLGEEKPGYFAVRMPPNRPAYIRLADAAASAEDSGTAAAGGKIQPPRVRPGGWMVSRAPLAIDPRPRIEEGDPVNKLPKPVIPPLDTPGRVAFSVLERGGSSIHTIKPNGLGPREVVQARYENTCPVWSPDGGRLAFISNRASLLAQEYEVFVMDADIENLTQLTTGLLTLGSAPGEPVDAEYLHCPVWSPDGEKLALVVADGEAHHLVILRAQGGPPQYIPVDYTSFSAPPVWSPDGERVLMVSPSFRGRSGGILQIDLTAARPQPLLIMGTLGWHDIYGIAFSPDGKRLAFIGATYMAENRPTRLDLYIILSDDPQAIKVVHLPESDLFAWVGKSALAWLPGDRLALLNRHRVDALYKTDVLSIDLNGEPEAQVQVVYRLEDMVYDAAWSPGEDDAGRWLLYSGDSGLYVLDMYGEAAPHLLTGERAYQVDWR